MMLSVTRLRLSRAVQAILVVLLCGPRIATAADPTEDELIRNGVDARKRQDDAAAFDLFAKAYALHHSPRAAAQMGFAEIALGRWVDAEAHLEEATAATNDPWIKKNTRTLSESLERIHQEVGRLDVVGSPNGSEIVIAGEVRGTLPLAQPIHVRAGEVRFELRAAGHASEVRTVRVLAGQLTRETVNLALLPPVATTPPANAAVTATTTVPPAEHERPTRPAGSGLRLTGVVLVGAGGLAVATGLVFGLKARAQGQSDAKASAFDLNADNTGHRYQTLQWVGYGVGAALIAGGAMTYFFGWRAREEQSTSVALAIIPDPNGVLPSVVGRF
jgi:hypothetical protein